MRRGPLLPRRCRSTASPPHPLVAPALPRHNGLTCRPPEPLSSTRGSHCPAPSSRPGSTEPDGAAPPPLLGRRHRLPPPAAPRTRTAPADYEGRAARPQPRPAVLRKRQERWAGPAAAHLAAGEAGRE
ncbi:hypothetical protein HJG60_009780 [Phyllostomus discolor]|uniref:Uncharacterized protein n=1 Tax=Phyllostomus discolor TaxID=89673 RepID=A0A834EPW3_9CHIR|nr:hypothetical protein HJG60_009780 [Phyllostomus discolor]